MDGMASEDMDGMGFAWTITTAGDGMGYSGNPDGFRPAWFGWLLYGLIKRDGILGTCLTILFWNDG